tara:strand:+ start:352 stop:714 length:363 start_codon:yes stop_codon:yes gene_type:complete
MKNTNTNQSIHTDESDGEKISVDQWETCRNGLEQELKKLKETLKIELEYVEDSLNHLEKIYYKEDADAIPDEIEYLYNDLIGYQMAYSRGELHHHGLDVNFEPFKQAMKMKTKAIEEVEN